VGQLVAPPPHVETSPQRPIAELVKIESAAAAVGVDPGILLVRVRDQHPPLGQEWQSATEFLAGDAVVVAAVNLFEYEKQLKTAHDEDEEELELFKAHRLGR